MSENYYIQYPGDPNDDSAVEDTERKCCIYLFGNDGGKYDGKTVTIRTYMYGDMALMDRYFYRSPERIFFRNEKAKDITPESIKDNPELGIFEYQYTFNNPLDGDEHDGTHFHISFCENPYMSQPEVIVHKGSVWEEIKNLQSVEGYDSAVVAATAVRYTAQSLTDTQQKQARDNIGAVTLAEVLEALPIYNGEVEEV